MVSLRQVTAWVRDCLKMNSISPSSISLLTSTNLSFESFYADNRSLVSKTFTYVFFLPVCCFVVSDVSKSAIFKRFCLRKCWRNNVSSASWLTMKLNGLWKFNSHYWMLVDYIKVIEESNSNYPVMTKFLEISQ